MVAFPAEESATSLPGCLVGQVEDDRKLLITGLRYQFFTLGSPYGQRLDDTANAFVVELAKVWVTHAE